MRIKYFFNFLIEFMVFMRDLLWIQRFREYAKYYKYIQEICINLFWFANENCVNKIYELCLAQTQFKHFLTNLFYNKMKSLHMNLWRNIIIFYYFNKNLYVQHELYSGLFLSDMGYIYYIILLLNARTYLAIQNRI